TDVLVEQEFVVERVAFSGLYDEFIRPPCLSSTVDDFPQIGRASGYLIRGRGEVVCRGFSEFVNPDVSGRQRQFHGADIRVRDIKKEQLAVVLERQMGYGVLNLQARKGLPLLDEQEIRPHTADDDGSDRGDGLNDLEDLRNLLHEGRT